MESVVECYDQPIHSLGDLQNMEFLSNLSSWNFEYFDSLKTFYLYYHGRGRSYPQLELIINEQMEWKLAIEGIIRSSKLEWLDLPSNIHATNDLKSILSAIEKLKLCSAINADKLPSLCKDKTAGQSIYHTKSGELEAVMKTVLSKGHIKVIRSTYCMYLLPADDVVDTGSALSDIELHRLRWAFKIRDTELCNKFANQIKMIPIHFRTKTRCPIGH